MKNLKILFAVVVLICVVGVTQSNAQAYIEKGSEYKPLMYEADGMQYFAWAYMEYQYEGTPSGNFNWVAHGTIVAVFNYETGEYLDPMPLPKRTVKAVDPNGYDEKVTINPQGKVTVVAHVKIEFPWW